MNKIALVTDSCADISPKYCKKYNIRVIPLRILYGEEEFEDGVSIAPREVYRRQVSEQAKTSLPSGEAIARVLLELREQGYDKVICIHLSSGLSGTYQMVKLLGEDCVGMEVRAFDSRSGSLGMGLVVVQVAKLIAAGMPWSQLLTVIPQLIAQSKVVFCIDTLEFLQKGGRIGRISAMAGTMLQVKPLLSFAPTGELTNIAKVRGRKLAMAQMVKQLEIWCPQDTPFCLAIAHGDTLSEFKELRALVREKFPNCTEILEGEIDCTLAVHVGPHLLGAAILPLPDVGV